MAAIETGIGVAAGWPAQFMGKGDPGKVASQWVSVGTAISPPLFLFIALGIGGALAFVVKGRVWRVVGGALLTLIGLISTVATLGEVAAAATPAVPRGAQWSCLIGTVVSVVLVGAGMVATRQAARRTADG
ncbi:MAG: hypothetical protein ACRDYZ_10130 [Acidimicrobiales bacterium]